MEPSNKHKRETKNLGRWKEHSHNSTYGIHKFRLLLHLSIPLKPSHLGSILNDNKVI